ncbi:adenine nucleotide alpha hydrolases-like protein [Myriangium duriaei CBS 260.36]|uniref:Adenine nucleotide alpha hydrolases-like protein n=1 Tax=Myriangium duriaei CBS 260.36 TaxID=1168546 RepID=A0A9P4J1W4_9PEZI|nr:adenine nucleotide alpha hydrolases-like protein [Myriangium duriaei CBS 260.36]
MSLGLGKALLDDAREWLGEDEVRKQSIAKRRMSGKDVTPLPLDRSDIRPESSGAPASAVTTSSVSPQKDIAKDEPLETQVATPKPPVETAAAFAHRRKLSEETKGRPTAMSSVYGGHKIKLPGDVGNGGSSRLPGDLGPNDPRRAPSPVPPASKSQSPTGRRAVGTPSKTGRPRRSSDGALLRPKKKREGSDDATARLAEDKDSGSSGSESESDSDDERGRGRDRSSRNNSVVESESEDSGADRRGNPPQSPSITVTPPAAGAEPHSKKKSVHPHSAYDHSAASTPRNSDDEEQLSDLRRAQKLALTISPIHSTPSAHRAIRQIIRGDYAHLQREAEQGRRRQRVYLVATDLSPEAEYALEWTIGTVLRDGDTLLALYAVDEEGGTGGGSEGVEIGHGADVIKDTAKIVGNLPSERVAQSPGPARSPLRAPGSQSRGPAGATPTDKTRAERERIKAAEGISERVIRLLRKTRLQIRVVVEVFHCKSPRHMITEVIDFLSPTMTILGSRGRSALKGVLLGSFSNYIVTKSSVPVMVARRRLKKHSKQKLHKDGLPVAGTGDGRMRIGRMSNVLEAPGGSGRKINRLSVAKVD